MWNPDAYFSSLEEQLKPAFSFEGQAEEWPAWREQLKTRFIEQLGGFPEQRADLSPVLLERKELEGYVRERVEITTYTGLRMPMYVLIPRNKKGPFAPVVALHGHGYGSKEIVGLEPDGNERQGEPGRYKDFAIQLAERGFLVLVPELLGFGDRRLLADQHKPPEESSCNFISARLLMQGQTIAGYRVYETMRAIDYLAERPDADLNRIGCMGISGGGLVAGFTAAVDERIHSTVISGYTNTFKGSILTRLHCFDNYVPGILQTVEMPDLISLICPRSLFIEAGKEDTVFPFEPVLQAHQRLEEVYRTVGAKDKLAYHFFDGGHEISGAESYDWLEQHLS